VAQHRSWSAGLALVTAATLVAAACGSSSKKTSTATTAAAGGSASTASTAAAASSKYPAIPAGPIKLAVITPESGANAAYGVPTAKAFENVTQKFFNQFHPDGVDGHPVQIVVYDDGSDVTKGVQAANQIVADKNAAVITVSTSPATTDQEMAVFAKNHMPVIAYPAGDKYTDAANYPYVFGTTANNKQYMGAGADWVGKHPEIKKIAVLTDGSGPETELLNDFEGSLKTAAPQAQIIKTVTISPGSVDVTTPIAQLKAANPDLLFINVGYGYGPIWDAMHSASWSPRIMDGSWYEAFSSMGALADNAVVAYEDCVQPNHAPFPSDLVNLMNGYAQLFGSTSVNYLTFVQSDSNAPELFKLAVEKNHSISPDAIKNAFETMGPTTIFGTYQYSYTPTDHWAVTGAYGPAVCKMTPFSDGNFRIPFIAP
jgi:ABC-type branched-subunit amino acid transport system substrate-binding protein